MAKVVFEFDDTDDEMDDINFIVNRNKIRCALYDIQDLFRRIYNGKLYSEVITIKDGKVLTEEDYKNYADAGEYPVKDTHQYIDYDFIENELDKALEDVRYFLD